MRSVSSGCGVTLVIAIAELVLPPDSTMVTTSTTKGKAAAKGACAFKGNALCLTT